MQARSFALDKPLVRGNAQSFVMSPPAGVRQLVNHRLGSTLAGGRQLAPIDLSHGLVAGGLGSPVDETKRSDSFRAMSLALLPDVLAAIDLDASALQVDAAPEAFIRDGPRRASTFLDRRQLTTRRAHRRLGHAGCGTARGTSRHPQHEGQERTTSVAIARAFSNLSAFQAYTSLHDNPDFP
jgi:hypothetical protein